MSRNRSSRRFIDEADYEGLSERTVGIISDIVEEIATRTLGEELSGRNVNTDDDVPLRAHINIDIDIY